MHTLTSPRRIVQRISMSRFLNRQCLRLSCKLLTFKPSTPLR
jgi:hypothetical protein